MKFVTLLIAVLLVGSTSVAMAAPPPRHATPVSRSAANLRVALKHWNCVRDHGELVCPQPPPRSFFSFQPVNCSGVCDGGGYTQLPQCGPSYYGVTLYYQGLYWTCIKSSPDHWKIV